MELRIAALVLGRAGPCGMGTPLVPPDTFDIYQHILLTLGIGKLDGFIVQEDVDFTLALQGPLNL